MINISQLIYKSESSPEFHFWGSSLPPSLPPFYSRNHAVVGCQYLGKQIHRDGNEQSLLKDFAGSSVWKKFTFFVHSSTGTGRWLDSAPDQCPKGPNRCFSLRHCPADSANLVAILLVMLRQIAVTAHQRSGMQYGESRVFTWNIRFDDLGGGIFGGKSRANSKNFPRKNFSVVCKSQGQEERLRRPPSSVYFCASAYGTMKFVCRGISLAGDK